MVRNVFVLLIFFLFRFVVSDTHNLMNEKNARNCINFLLKHFRWAQNLSFSRFVIEYILEKFIKLSATRVQARVENRIILKLYTYCPIIHSGFSIFASVDFPLSLSLEQPMMHAYVYVRAFTTTCATPSTPSNSQSPLASALSVGVFYTLSFFLSLSLTHSSQTLAIWYFIFSNNRTRTQCACARSPALGYIKHFVCVCERERVWTSSENPKTE